MFNALSFGGAALAVGATAVVPNAANAQRHGRAYRESASQAYANPHSDGYGRRGYDRRDYDRPAQYSRNGNRGCNNGTGGTIIGAIAGGLLGRTVDTRGDRAFGTVVGAGAGALAGNAVGRSGNPEYCRR